MSRIYFFIMPLAVSFAISLAASAAENAQIAEPQGVTAQDSTEDGKISDSDASSPSLSQASTQASSQSSSQSSSQTPSQTSSALGHEKTHSKARHRKGRVAREKEAEGTQAPNRFDADTILKSRYELNGQSLEVDPD